MQQANKIIRLCSYCEKPSEFDVDSTGPYFCCDACEVAYRGTLGLVTAFILDLEPHCRGCRVYNEFLKYQGLPKLRWIWHSFSGGKDYGTQYNSVNLDGLIDTLKKEYGHITFQAEPTNPHAIYVSDVDGQIGCIRKIIVEPISLNYFNDALQGKMKL